MKTTLPDDAALLMADWIAAVLSRRDVSLVVPRKGMCYIFELKVTYIIGRGVTLGSGAANADEGGCGKRLVLRLGALVVSAIASEKDGRARVGRDCTMGQ